MGKLVKFELDREGVRELLTSPAMQAECLKYANAAVGSLGEGYVVETRNYPERSGAIVKTNTFKAARENAKNNTILKAVGV